MTVRSVALLSLALSAAACGGTSSTTDAGTASDVQSATDTPAATDVQTATDTGARTDTGAATDSGTRTDAAADPWGCIGHVTNPASTGTMANYTVTLTEPQAHTMLAGVTLKACGRTDSTCTTPLAMGTSSATGTVTLSFAVGASGFDGYFEASGGTGANQVVPTRTFMNPPLPAQAPGFTDLVVSQGTFGLLGAVLGADLMHHGLILGSATNCAGAAAGIQAALAPPGGAGHFYIGATGLPDTSATETGDNGQFGFINVPAGMYTVTTTRTMGMTRIGSYALDVREGYVSASVFGPSN